MIVEVNLLNSFAWVRLVDLWLDFGVDLFLSDMSIADFLVIGVRLFPLLGRSGALNFAGEDGTLDVLALANTFEEDWEGFILLVTSNSSSFVLPPCIITTTMQSYVTQTRAVSTRWHKCW